MTATPMPIARQLLRRFNLSAALLHAAQAVAVVVLASDVVLPVMASYLAG